MDLATYLSEKDITQSEFAEQIGAAQALVSQWVREKRPIAPRWAIPIERATGGIISRHDVAPEIYPREN